MRRRLATIAALAAGIVATPVPALAHGVGVRGDLPVPLWAVSYGAGAVLVITFVGLARAWPEPRLEGGGLGRPLPAGLDRTARLLEWPLRLLGVGLFALVIAAGLLGPAASTANLAPYGLYVALWVGGMMVSGLVGDVYAVLDPLQTAYHLQPGDDEPTRSRIGVWPAAAGLLAFNWLELAYHEPADPRMVAVAVVVLLGGPLLAGVWAGRWWLRGANPFGAFFRVLGAMAPFHRDVAGRLRVRLPLTGLVRLEPLPGLVALVLVSLGSTTFDGVTRTELWDTVAGQRSGWALAGISTVGLLVTVAVVAALYLWAMREAARRTHRRTSELAGAFAHTLVPIALGYAIAHYFSLLVFEGQRLLALLSDPFDAGWNLLGTADWQVDFTAVSTTTIAVVQVAAIVLGHVAAVVLAHDRAIALLPAEEATRSQHALLLVMVAYTIAGLGLLLGA